MIVERSTTCFSATYAILNDLRESVRAVARQVGLEEKKIEALVLAADEAATNIISHAAAATPCDILCTVGSTPEGDAMVCELAYTAETSFIPLELPTPRDIEARVRSLKRGGLGVYLTHKLVDEIEYRREGDANVIRLKSYVKPK